MTGSPFILAGVVVVIVAIVAGIAATILKSRSDTTYAYPPPGTSYEPPEAHGDEPADLSKLDALLGGAPGSTAAAAAVAPDPPEEDDDEPEAEPEPEPEAASVAVAEAPPDVIDAPERDEDEPLPGLWAHLVETEEGPLGVQDRIDMVARLEMVGEKWCVDALKSATDEERDPQVNAAVRAALARIG